MIKNGTFVDGNGAKPFSADVAIYGDQIFEIGNVRMHLLNLDLEALRGLISADWAMPCLGDAGVFVCQMINSGLATFTLSHWHRDNGLFSIQEAYSWKPLNAKNIHVT